ncbi:MAG: helix-turn-helix domain-containing protein [Waterburya sp.]
MTKAIAIYNSMAEFYASTGRILNQEVDFTIHSLEEIHGDVPYKSSLFRTNYYTIVMIAKGQGKYIVDRYTYLTKSGTIYFSNPGHIKGFEIDVVPKGFIITFAESFLKQYVHKDIFDEFPFLIAEVVPPQYPDNDIFQEFYDLGNQLLRDYQNNSNYKFKIIGSLMVVLLLKIKERFWQTYNSLNEFDSSSQIVLDFKRNLEKHFRSLQTGDVDTLYQVKDYAEVQSLHPSYLSTVIKRKTGKSVNNWIAEKVIAEAQAILSRSPISVQEVASQLGFKEPGHFSRFFKKHTGTSPSSFRENLTVQN